MKFVDFLYSGFEFTRDETLLKFKFKLLNSILLIVSIFSILFGLMSDFGLNDIGPIQSKVDYAYGFFSFLLIFFLRLSKNNYRASAYILLVISLVTFTSALINVPQDEFRMIWFYLIVHVAYTLLDSSFGKLATVASILIILVSNYLVDLQLSSFAINSCILGLVIASLLSHVYTKRITDYETNLSDALGMLKRYIDEVENLNKNLSEEVKKELEKNRLNEEYMQTQARMAQMGEMISMIAHQWRQPLSAISAISINLEVNIELENFDFTSAEGVDKSKRYLLDELDNINRHVQDLSIVIDDFRNFYKPNKKSEIMKFEDVVIKSLKIIKASIMNENIELVEEYNSDVEMELYSNEMMQVILNILKNAQDNFKDKKIENPYIRIVTEEKRISIYDNGGGIPEDIIGKVFDPYFSTKDEKNGTGIGLYMSKKIVEDHHNGLLSVANIDQGVCFTLDFKK